MKKAHSSFYDTLALSQSKGSEVIRYLSSNISLILRSSKGRNKLLGIIQYCADIYKECMIDYLASKRIKEWPISVRNSKVLNSSMKTGRKVFRLFRWLEEISGIINKCEKKTGIIATCKIFKHLTSAVYYALDNIVWLAKIGMISDAISNIKWERTKNFVSIVKYILLIFITALSANEVFSKEREIKTQLQGCAQPSVIFNSDEYKQTVKLLRCRAKRRFQMIETIRAVLRLTIVYKNLKFPGSKLISSTFIAICGLLSASLSISKILIIKEEQKMHLAANK